MGLYVSHPSSLGHDTGGHPESADRLRAIEAALEGAGWPGLERMEAPAATREQLLRVHSGGHVDAIAALSARGGGMVDLDTVASAGSYEAALHAAGGAAAAAERLLANGAGFAFCALRPPGHHAERDRAMGFCLFNNVAVAAAHAISELGAERVLVCDWDVHHGNGTEAIFLESDQVLYASIHQDPLYPGTGGLADVGSGKGEGFTVNLPVAAGSGRDQYMALVEHVVVPVARRFDPDLVAISAGYDAHAVDPLASCRLSAADYGEMSAALRDCAAVAGAPVLVCLEGGYALEALAESVLATVRALAGEGTAGEAPIAPALPHRRRLSPYWDLD